MQINIADKGLRAFYALKRDVPEFVNPNADMLCDKLVAWVILCVWNLGIPRFFINWEFIWSSVNGYSKFQTVPLIKWSVEN